MEKAENKTMNLFENARMKINITRLALDKVIDDNGGEVDYDMAESILMMITEAHEAMEALHGPFSEMHSELASIKEGFNSKYKKVA